VSDEPKGAETLRHLLEGTRDQELDCDRFFALLGPYLDGEVSAPELRDQIEHHARMCPECAEELDIVKRALG
jgi:hypothetical protein